MEEQELIDVGSTEYIALVGSFVLVGLEAIIRLLTLALRAHRYPTPALDPFNALT